VLWCVTSLDLTGGTYVECHAVDAPPPPPATPYSLLRAIDSEDEMRALLNLIKQGEHTAYAPQGDGEVFRCVFVGVVRRRYHPGSQRTGI
jgi:hypothetical protein